MPSTSSGHNNPPPSESFGMHIDDLFSLLSDTLAGGEVDSDDKEAAIDDLLGQFREAAKDADKNRAEEKKPHLEAGKAVDASWKPVIEKAKRGMVACKEALTPWRTEKQRAKDEAARKAREEAEAKEEEARKALQQSDDLEAKYRAEQEIETAKKLKATANKIDRSATGLRTYWEAEITDRKKALIYYIERSPERFEELIQQMANEDARTNRPPVPGITYHERKRAA